MRRFSSLAALAAVASVAAAAPAGAVTLTNGTMFRADATGTNQNTVNGGATAGRGAWTTVLGQQNVPGNYGAQLFFSLTATPGAGDFLSPASNLQLALQEGDNTIYFWGDGDDLAGGTAGFGFNFFFNGAGATSPLISAFAPNAGGFAANATTGCTVGYSFACTPGSGALSGMVGGSTITLSALQILGVGAGGGSTEDRVYHDNVNGFTPPVRGNGVTDTYGFFTINVRTPSGAVPEPGAWALMIAGFGLAGASLRKRRAFA